MKKIPEIKHPSYIDYLNNQYDYFVKTNLWWKIKGRPSNYIVHSTKFIIHRSLNGPIKVPVTRYYYVDPKTNKKHYCYIQEQYEEIVNTNQIEQIIKKSLLSSASYQEISNKINNSYSRSTVMNLSRKHILVKNWSNLNQENKTLIPLSNKFYVCVDDTYIWIRTNKSNREKYRCRLIVIHQGKINKKIINKVILIELLPIDIKPSTSEIFAERILKKIKSVFNISVPEIYFISDGARWMKKLAKKLKVQCHFLDRWHVAQLINQSFPRTLWNLKEKFRENYYSYNESNLNKCLIKLINDGLINELLRILDLFLTTFEKELTEIKIQNINKLIRFIKNNKKILLNYQNENLDGTQIEAFVNHHIKKNVVKKFSIYGKEMVKFNILKSLKKTDILFIYDNKSDLENESDEFDEGSHLKLN